MIRLFVRHPVSDFAAWRKSYDAFDEERRGMGVKGHGVFQTTDNPRDVTVWHDFETLAAAKAFAESPRLQEVMKEAGVAGEPTVWFAKEA